MKTVNRMTRNLTFWVCFVGLSFLIGLAYQMDAANAWSTCRYVPIVSDNTVCIGHDPSSDGIDALNDVPNINNTSLGATSSWEYDKVKVIKGPAQVNDESSGGGATDLTLDSAGEYELEFYYKCKTTGDVLTTTNKPVKLPKFTVVEVTIETKLVGETIWNSSGTNIHAGGFDTDPHKADVKISLGSFMSGETVKIRLTGDGAGYASSDWWWSKSAVGATLEISGQSTYTHGDSDLEVTVPSNGEITGTLTSSNELVTTTIEVEHEDSGCIETHDVDFGIGKFEVSYSTDNFVPDEWIDFTVSLKLGEDGVKDHDILVVVSEVVMVDGTTHSASDGGSQSSSTSLVDYVILDQGAIFSNKYDTGTTDSSGEFDSELKIVDENVKDFTLTLFDRSIKE